MGKIIDCTFCNKNCADSVIIGKITNSAQPNKLNIELTKKTILDSTKKARILKDNEFVFYLRHREEEFKFCSVKCVSAYMIGSE